MNLVIVVITKQKLSHKQCEQNDSIVTTMTVIRVLTIIIIIVMVLVITQNPVEVAL